MEIEQRYTVAGLLRTNTERTPDNTMLVDRGQSWTWAEHHARACRVAHALRSDGIGPGVRGSRSWTATAPPTSRPSSADRSAGS